MARATIPLQHKIPPKSKMLWVQNLRRYIGTSAGFGSEALMVSALKTFSGLSDGTLSIEDKGDSCNPKPWEWVSCSTTSPPQITKLLLSRKNLTGDIPFELQNMDELTELWLDGNSLTGPIPHISNLISLRIIHLENNRLSGNIPSYISALPSLQELDIWNNCLSGKIPSGLLTRKLHFKWLAYVSFHMLFNEGNPKLTQGQRLSQHSREIIGCSVAAAVTIMFLGIFLLIHFRKRC